MESIKSKIKKAIYNAFPKNFKTFLTQEMLNQHEYFKYLNISFSQEGEDQILSHYFYGLEEGFFIDIGAHHPIKFSNTYKFYLNGWKGINVDAMPGSMNDFQLFRPNDINIELGVSNTADPVKYYIFNTLGVNTFSEEFAQEMIEKGSRLTQTINLPTKKLKEILETYLPDNQKINFLTLDVENLELEVLKSNDWNTFRPELIVVESLQQRNKAQLESYLMDVNYRLTSQTINNLYFTDIETIPTSVAN